MTLSNTTLVEECNHLIRLDLEAIAAYDEAIQAVKEAMVRDKLITYRADHARHVTDLSAIVQRYGGKPVDSGGVRARIRKTVTRVAGFAGVASVLQMLKAEERLTNDAYAKRAVMDLPTELHAVIESHYADERLHLAWVTDTLRTRAWEQPQPRA